MAMEAFRLRGVFESVGVDKVLQAMQKVSQAGQALAMQVGQGLGRMGQTAQAQAPGLVTLGRAGEQAFTQINTQVNQVINNITKIPREAEKAKGGFNAIKAAIQSAGVVQFVGQVQQLTRSFVAASSEMQGYKVRLTQLSKDANEANAIFNKISKYESLTPFELPELVDGAARLKAIGFTADEITGKFGRLAQAGELSALTGGKRRIDDFVNALGKIRGGKSEGFEILQESVGLSIAKFRELGGPVDRTGQIMLRTTRDVKQAEEAIRRFIQETTKFKLAEAASGTIAGKFSNLQSEIFKTADAFGQALVPVLDALIKVAQPVLQWLQNLDPNIRAGIALTLGFVAVLGTLASVLAPLVLTISAASTALTAFFAIGRVAAFTTSVSGAVSVMQYLFSGLVAIIQTSFTSVLGAITGSMGALAAGVAGVVGSILAVLGTIALATVSLNQQTAATNEVINSAEQLNAAFRDGTKTVQLTTEELIRQGKTAQDIADQLLATQAQIKALSAKDAGLSGQGIGGDLSRFASALNPFATNESQSDTSAFNAGMRLLRRQKQQKLDLEKVTKERAEQGQKPDGRLGTTGIQDEMQLIEKEIALNRLSRAEAIKRYEALRENTKGDKEFAKQDLDIQIKLYEEKKKLSQEAIQDIEQRQSAEEAAGTLTARRRLEFIDLEIAAQRKAIAEEKKASEGRVSRESLAKLQELSNKRVQIVRQEGEEKRSLLQQQQAAAEAAGTATPQGKINNLQRQRQTLDLTTVEGKKQDQELKNQVIQTQRDIVKANQNAVAEIKRLSGDEFYEKRLNLRRETTEAIKSGVDRTTAYALEAQKRTQIDRQEQAQRISIAEQARQATLGNQRGRSDLRVGDLEYRQGRGESTAGSLREELRKQAEIEIQQEQSRAREAIANERAQGGAGSGQRILTAQQNLAEARYRIEEQLRQKLRELENREQEKILASELRSLEVRQSRAQTEADITKRRFEENIRSGKTADPQTLVKAIRNQAELEEKILRKKAEQEKLTATAEDKLSIQKKLDLDILAIRQKTADVLSEQLKTLQDMTGEQNKQAGFTLGSVTDQQGNAVQSFDPLAEARAQDDKAKAERDQKEAARKAKRDIEIAKAQADREADKAARTAGVDLKTGKDAGPSSDSTGKVSRINAIDKQIAGLDLSTKAGAEKAAELRAERDKLTSKADASAETPTAPGDVLQAGKSPKEPKAGPTPTGDKGGDKGAPVLTGEATIVVKVEYPNGPPQTQTGKLLLQPRPSPYSDKVPPGSKGQV